MKTPSPHDDFEATLRRDALAARQRAQPSDDLAQRIAREVHRSRPPAATPARHRSIWQIGVLALAGAAACAALAFLALRPEAGTPADRQIAATDSDLFTASASATETPDGAALWAALKPEAQALLAEDPLQTEVDAVVSDARSALDFLALNFLPSPAAPPRSG